MDWWFISNPSEQEVLKNLDKDTDRAAAIVAAAILDKRLTDAISYRFHPHDEIHGSFFRSTGPLGTFSVKIDMAYVLGLIGSEAHRDLMTIKNIRNAFAHHLDIIDFDSQRIRDLCANLGLVERYVFERERYIFESKRDTSSSGPEKLIVRVGVENRNETLKNPRQRYILSALVLDMLIRVRRRDAPPLLTPLF